MGEDEERNPMNLNDLLPWIAAWFVMSQFFGWMIESVESVESVGDEDYYRDRPYWKLVLIIFVLPCVIIFSPIYLCLRFVVSLGESIYEMKVKR